MGENGWPAAWQSVSMHLKSATGAGAGEGVSKMTQKAWSKSCLLSGTTSASSIPVVTG